MHIGILQFELVIDAATNLKDKRRVVRSVKDRLHREHMVAVAEVDHLDIWNKAGMGLTCCSRDGAYLHQVLEAIVKKLESHPEARLGYYALDVVQASYITADAETDDGEPLWTEAELRDAEAEAESARETGELPSEPRS
jgi:uncharacterized protein